MKKMLFMLPVLVALFFVGCSSDSDEGPGENNGNKVLSEIVINEHEKISVKPYNIVISLLPISVSTLKTSYFCAL